MDPTRIALTVLSLLVSGLEAKHCRVKDETYTCFFGCCKASFSKGCCLPNQFGFFLIMVGVMLIASSIVACIHTCRRRPTYMAIPGANYQTMWYSQPHGSYDTPPGMPSGATIVTYPQNNTSDVFQQRFYQQASTRGFQPTPGSNQDRRSPQRQGTRAYNSFGQTQLPGFDQRNGSTSHPNTGRPQNQVSDQGTRGRTSEPLSGLTQIPVLTQPTHGRPSRPITGRTQNQTNKQTEKAGQTKTPVHNPQTNRKSSWPNTGQVLDPASN
ncbi:uncharacterized protein LOC124144470 [Haliotis rufescens]|uniref:uncharacterized protein LOC124144470 n=1 Tax=Haliotis rufescens TaxID=6454 RepID=UPI00201F314E|nr:uncharacterized protein LOC124144470 [Haliotis rufescens]